MAKLKTRKGMKRRIKVTKTGRLIHFRAGRRHLLTGKPARHTRRLRRSAFVSVVDQAKLRRLIPYS